MIVGIGFLGFTLQGNRHGEAEGCQVDSNRYSGSIPVMYTLSFEAVTAPIVAPAMYTLSFAAATAPAVVSLVLLRVDTIRHRRELHHLS